MRFEGLKRIARLSRNILHSLAMCAGTQTVSQSGAGGGKSDSAACRVLFQKQSSGVYKGNLLVLGKGADRFEKALGKGALSDSSTCLGTGWQGLLGHRLAILVNPFGNSTHIRLQCKELLFYCGCFGQCVVMFTAKLCQQKGMESCRDPDGFLGLGVLVQI